MDIERTLHSLPSMQSFLARAANGARGRVTLALIPNIVSREMVGRLILNRLGALNLETRELSGLGTDRPATAVAVALNVDWQSQELPRNAANLMRCEGMPQVVFAHRITSDDAEQRAEWREFIADWAGENDKLAAEGRPVPGLCIVAKLRDFNFSIPDPQAGLSVLWWWGMSSELETRLACRVANLEYDDGDALDVWREHVIPAMAAGDPQLAERLWERASEPLDAVISALSEYADETGLNDCEDNIMDAIRLIGEDARDCGAGEEPPASLRNLWASGGLSLVQERGVEIHPALLARRGRRGDIANLLWRGQAETLLPTLNEIRMEICLDFTRTFGEDWPSKWRNHPLPEGRNHLSAELADICRLFNFVGEGAGHSLNEKRYMYPLATLARDLRNKIAHNEPVSFADFSALLAERGKVGL